MNLFLINVLLAVGFMIALESFTLQTLVAGLVVGYGALWLTRPLYGDKRYFQRIPTLIGLVVFFIKALFVSNLRVLWDVVTPSHISRPGIIRLPLDARTDMEIMAVANLISLTPGTLSIDLSDDRHYLYVHVMFLDDVDAVRRELKDGLERRVLEVLR
ncbi:MAG: Na+/H+ antiporter subunit E [Deltaproteobacteria bacterium]|jgi:multicomponent Na+:H+ antiporter subunit E|nr:Na+/H+ antiporter subunit E [Deltaproteobacteria bacterium]